MIVSYPQYPPPTSGNPPGSLPDIPCLQCQHRSFPLPDTCSLQHLQYDRPRRTVPGSFDRQTSVRPAASLLLPAAWRNNQAPLSRPFRFLLLYLLPISCFTLPRHAKKERGQRESFMVPLRPLPPAAIISCVSELVYRKVQYFCIFVFECQYTSTGISCSTCRIKNRLSFSFMPITYTPCRSLL